MGWLMLLAALPLAAQPLAEKAPIERGQKIYTQSCAVGYCHGEAGQAMRSPSLRARPLEEDHAYKVIRDGVPLSTMTGWKDRLTDEDIRAVAAYVTTLAKTPAEVPKPVPQAAPPRFTGPPQAARGYAVYFDESKPTRCATCHALGGRGTAVGPDLSRLARLNPRGIVVAILASRTQYVQTIKLKTGPSFAAMHVAHDDKTMQVHDLSVTPPQLRKLERAQVDSVTDNATWKHPPESAQYSMDQLAAVIAYIRWASFGDTKGVDPKELE